MKHLSDHAIEYAVLGLILAASIFLRWHNLADNPAWYTDEATHVDIAQHLLTGEVRYMAIADSWLLFARLPLFEVSASGAFALFGVSLHVLRLLTASFGILTTVLLFAAMRHLSRDLWLALLVCGVYAIFPQAALYSRFGFSYNLLAPLIVVMLWSGVLALRGHGRVPLLIYGFCVGLGCLSDVLFWPFVPVSLLWLWRCGWRDTLVTLLIMTLPLGLYLLFSYAVVPEAFVFDLTYTLSRTDGGTLAEQWRTLSNNITRLLSDGYWWLLGILGLISVRDQAMRRLALLFLLPLLIIGRNVALYNLSAYYTIPFLPLVALGIGALMRFGLPYAASQLNVLLPRLGWLVLSLLLLMTIGTNVWQLQRDVQTQFITAIEPFLIVPEDARAVADFLNPSLTPTSTIIASAGVGWLLEGQVADFQMAVAAAGVDSVHIPGNLPQERFIFNAEYDSADYIVVDNLWHNWGVVHIPYVAEMVVDIEANWVRLYETKTITVYRNPAD